MEQYQDIKNWLASERPFDVGRSLFMKYGTNPRLKTRLAHNTPWARNTLAYELEKIAKIGAPIKHNPHMRAKGTPAKPAKPVPPKKVVSVRTDKQTGDSPEVAAIKTQLSKTRGEMMVLQNQLEHTRSDERRKAMAFRILELQDMRDKLFERLELAKVGKTPEKQTYKWEGKTKDVLIKRLHNVRTYVSRYRDVPGKEEVLAKYEAELKALEDATRD